MNRPDYRALCAELLDFVERLTKHYYEPAELTIRARAALSEPEPEGPTLDDIWELCEEHGFVLGVHGANEEESANGLWAIARAVLARWGRPVAEDSSAVQPADGEVAELATAEMVRQLRTKAATEKSNRCHYSATLLTRAADLLAQRYPQPVPVSERLPGPELCWWYEPDEDDDGSGYGSSWTLLRIRGGTVNYTHWLPAHALPLPGEVKG